MSRVTRSSGRSRFHSLPRLALGRMKPSLTTTTSRYVGIDSASPALVPTLAVALVAPAALAVANLVAAWPGWVAARVAPAVVMRAE